jgi:hypothetical protein
MAKKLTEGCFFETAIVPQSIDDSNVTGHYYSIAGVRRVLLVGLGGAAAATKTFKVEALEATDVDGTSAASVDSATGTANTKVKKATVALAAVGTDDTVTVTAYLGSTAVETATYTKASSADADANEFDDADELCTQITADFDHVSAADSTTNAVITADEGYTITVTSTDDGGTVTVATNEWTVVLELQESDLDVDAPYIAPKITATGDGIYGCLMVLEKELLPVTQAVAAS